MKIAIILVTYNGTPWLAKTLDAVRNSTVASKIFVVDNGSSDHSVRLLKTYGGEIKIMASKENHGFGKANNMAMSAALKEGYEQFLVLNQDAYLEPDCLQKLSATLAANPDYGLMSPVHLNGTKNALDHGFVLHLKKNNGIDLLNSFLMEKKENLYAVEFINAACWLLSKACLKKVGGFDPLFYHYGEDDNLVQRMHYHGFKVGLLTTCFAMHDRLPETKPNKKKRNALLSRLELIRLSDVRQDFEQSWSATKKMYRKALLKSLLTLRIGEAFEKRNQWKTLARKKAAIQNSRSTNTTTQPYKYLDFEEG